MQNENEINHIVNYVMKMKIMNRYSCVGETTGSLIRHLKIMHKIYQPETSTFKRYVLCTLENNKYKFIYFI